MMVLDDHTVPRIPGREEKKWPKNKLQALWHIFSPHGFLFNFYQVLTFIKLSN